MSVWDNDPKTCTHEGTERCYEYKDDQRIMYCGGCGTTISSEPDPKSVLPEGRTKRDDLDEYFKVYANEAKSVGGTSILSYRGWIEEGRPTFQERKERFSKPTQTLEGENTTTMAKEKAEKKDKAPRPAGAKTLVRQILTAQPTASFSLEELAQQTGKPTSSITTAISDLKSSKYCKPGDPLVIHRSKAGRYSLTAFVEEAEAGKTEGTTAGATGSEAPAAGTPPVEAPPADALPVV